MMANITTIEELYTDGITAAGVTRYITFHFRARYDDGSTKWHYYGTPVPAGVEAEEHARIMFPPDMLNLPTANDTLYSLALEAALNKIGSPL
jgi:hypothetical protein